MSRLAWRLSNTMEVGFWLEALEEALTKGRPEVFNTDQSLPCMSTLEYQGQQRRR